MKLVKILKKNWVTFLFLVFVILLVWFSSSNIGATKNALKIWANNVVPALFPFFVASELLNNTNIVYFFSKALNKIMRPIFNLPGNSSYAFVMGLISGYPVGAKIVCNLYSRGECTKDEAERMIAFTNNSGPLFVIGTVGIGFYGNSTIGGILWIVHIISSIVVGITLGILSRKNKSENNNRLNKYGNNIKIQEFGEVLGNAILSGIKSVLIVGGFVVFFSVVISILKSSGFLSIVSDFAAAILKCDSNLIKGLIIGIIEFTNGLSEIASIHLKNITINLSISSFLIGFGGIAVMLQVLSIISKDNLQIKKYFIGKLLQGTLSAIIILIAFSIPVLNLNL